PHPRRAPEIPGACSGELANRCHPFARAMARNDRAVRKPYQAVRTISPIAARRTEPPGRALSSIRQAGFIDGFRHTLANDGAQQLSHRPDRADPPCPRHVASTKRRRYMVEERVEAGAALIKTMPLAL